MIVEGKFVQIEYTGTFKSGEEFDSNIGGKPLEFQVGSGMIIPGIEKEVLGMKVEEEKNISINPVDAYGEYDETQINSIPIEEVRKDFEPEVGMTVVVGSKDGGQIPAVISQIKEDLVLIDYNHPLAGKTLNFKFKVLAITDEAQFDHNTCGCCSDDKSNGESGCCSDDKSSGKSGCCSDDNCSDGGCC